MKLTMLSGWRAKALEKNSAGEQEIRETEVKMERNYVQMHFKEECRQAWDPLRAVYRTGVADVQRISSQPDQF